MAKKILQKNGDFIVGEEKVLLYILSFLFFALFLYGLIDAGIKGFEKIDYQSYIFTVALVPAIILFLKGYRNRIHIRINRNGIYHNERMVTNWANFVNAFVTQKEVLISIQDNFILVVEYINDKTQKGLRRKIPLTNTQNKSEEEVMAAITFYYKLYKGLPV